MKVINVLGTEYRIIEVDQASDPILKNSSGYCDGSVKKIVLDNLEADKKENDSLENLDLVKQDTLRHEIVHAFMNESGLKNECSWKREEMVDWVALQFPKMMKAMKESGALE